MTVAVVLVVEVVPMLHGGVPARVAMDVVLMLAVVFGVGLGLALVPVCVVLGMGVAVVQVVDMAAVLHGGVATGRAVTVVLVVGVLEMGGPGAGREVRWLSLRAAPAFDEGPGRPGSHRPE
jgi:hypothetical protein